MPKSYVQIRALCQSIMASADDEGIVRASRDMLMLLESRPREVIEFEARCIAATLCLAVSITVFFLGTRLPSPWLRSAVFPVLLSTPLPRWILHSSVQQQLHTGCHPQMDLNAALSSMRSFRLPRGTRPYIAFVCLYMLYSVAIFGILWSCWYILHFCFTSMIAATMLWNLELFLLGSDSQIIHKKFLRLLTAVVAAGYAAVIVGCVISASGDKTMAAVKALISFAAIIAAVKLSKWWLARAQFTGFHQTKATMRHFITFEELLKKWRMVVDRVPVLKQSIKDPENTLIDALQVHQSEGLILFNTNTPNPAL